MNQITLTGAVATDPIFRPGLTDPAVAFRLLVPRDDNPEPLYVDVVAAVPLSPPNAQVAPTADTHQEPLVVLGPTQPQISEVDRGEAHGTAVTTGDVAGVDLTSRSPTPPASPEGGGEGEGRPADPAADQTHPASPEPATRRSGTGAASGDTAPTLSRSPYAQGL